MSTKLYPGSENQFDKSAKEMSIPNMMDNKDYGKPSKVGPRKIMVRSSGKPPRFYGARTIMTKEGTYPTFMEWLNEGEEDYSALPDLVVSEIKKNIRAGARDTTQQWKDALELVHRAYFVANVRRPVPTDTAAWEQYMTLVRTGVKELAATRGLTGDWRLTRPMIKEAAEINRKKQELPTKRFFVEVPGQSAIEVDGEDLDDIVEQTANSFRRRGMRVRIKSKDDVKAILSLWRDDKEVERIVIKQV